MWYFCKRTATFSSNVRVKANFNWLGVDYYDGCIAWHVLWLKTSLIIQQESHN